MEQAPESDLCKLFVLRADGRKRPYDHEKAMAKEAAELQEQLSSIASAENAHRQPREPEEATPASMAPRRCSLLIASSDMRT